MKQIISIFLFLAITVSAQAQPKLPALREGIKSITTSPIAMRHLISLRAAGLEGLASATELHYTQMKLEHPVLQSAVLQNTAPIPKYTRPWLEQQKRDFKAWKLKRERRQHDKKQADFQRQQEKLPQLLPAHTFQAIDFTPYTPEIKQSPRPVLPFLEEKQIAFRGIALSTDGDDVRNILQNGLRIQDSGEESNTLRMAYASHGGYTALRPFIENSVINITCSPRSALYWGSKRLNSDKRLLVIIKLRGEWDGMGLEVVTTDIPASQIETLAVRLNINGLLTWCKAELNPDGSFTLTPYERIYDK